MKELRYFIVYKPYQVLSQFSGSDNKKTLKDFFHVSNDVYPIGRLDYDSEGLLILTNDKQLNYQLLNPNFSHEREYWVQVEGNISAEAIMQLQNSVEINVDGKIYQTKKCIAKFFEEEPKVLKRNPPIRFRKNIPTSWIKTILTEGKNRQVRKMLAAVEFPVLRLIRVRIENLEIGNLNIGEMRELSRKTAYAKLFRN